MALAWLCSYYYIHLQGKVSLFLRLPEDAALEVPANLQRAARWLWFLCRRIHASWQRVVAGKGTAWAKVDFKNRQQRSGQPYFTVSQCTYMRACGVSFCWELSAPLSLSLPLSLCFSHTLGLVVLPSGVSISKREPLSGAWWAWDSVHVMGSWLAAWMWMWTLLPVCVGVGCLCRHVHRTANAGREAGTQRELRCFIFNDWTCSYNSLNNN